MHNPAAIPLNDTHKHQRDFDIQTEHLSRPEDKTF